MKILGALLSAVIILDANDTLALPAARNVSSQDAQATTGRGIDLKVWQGYGLTISFIPVGETIKQVWLGDPSRFALSSNGSLCQQGSNNQETCGVGGATVLFIRQIKPISFPSLTNSKDGSTVITILTSSGEGQGQKHYQFKLTPATGNPQYTSLIIHPSDSKPRTILVDSPIRNVPKLAQVRTQEKPSNNENPQPTSEPEKLNNSTNSQSNSSNNELPKENNLQVETKKNTIQSSSLQVGTVLKRNDANAVAYGLGVALNRGIIKPQSKEWNKAQDAIRLLRRGKNRTDAVRLSGISQELFNKLVEWGQN
ncbi:hypothetical protein [Anabaena azotica]|uniref:Uncharacterized protein n=1 Tax=Anabaena azotica FACHB-119 TaxID=947527 RepID=A0ABR8DCF5_9NOST|nr:hypothetical protein [Anabaena azotica]MBD2503902.1 hypothetical protein [Anabaena azotica FACHB-119]